MATEERVESEAEQVANPPSKTRRRFLMATAAAGITAVGLGGYATQIEPFWPETVERDLPIRGLPSHWIGKRIVQISDLHVGRIVSSDYLISELQKISAMKPAMTVITGDFMSCQGAEQISEVMNVMRHLEPGPEGCYAILGNHDYGAGWSNAAVAEELSERLTELKIRTLRNEVHAVNGLQLVGFDDLWGTNFRPEKVVSQVDWSGPTLTLCHNPDGVDLTALQPVRGWVLSGHTHGGQCKPPFLPPPLLPVRNRRYTSGAFDIGAGRNLYINRGMGFVRRIRFNARPEITVFRLVEENDA